MAGRRTATAVWEGDLLSGKGTTSTVTSKAISDVGITWKARTTEEAGAQTSPEELMAAAHASCFSMALSAGLAKDGTPAKKLDVESTVTFDKVGEKWTVVSSALKVRGTVPGIDAAKFKAAAEGAKDNCPVSRALQGNVKMSVEATLVK
ncbi:MAG: OsmC family peroxiredoxin [SAR202 cluster bacterium]|nr:OsmC family peroxiredoxin [SAR202 cluster bacterium]